MIKYISDLDEVERSSPFSVVAEDSRYPLQLSFISSSPSIQDSTRQFVSDYDVLLNSSYYDDIVRLHEEKRVSLYVHSSAQKVLDLHQVWRQPLEIDNLRLVDRRTGEASSLYPYQQYGLQRALHQVKEAEDSEHRLFMYFNFGTGTGKSVIAVAGALELFNRDEIDLAIVFTLRQVKSEIVNLFNSATNLTARNIEGEKAYRTKEYRKKDAQVYVMNYEKARSSIDLPELKKLVKGKRVLVCFDEVQKILDTNQARTGVDELLKSMNRSIIWPLSASVIQGNPERYWRVYEWASTNPLGSLSEFKKDYVKRTELRSIVVRKKNGQKFTTYEDVLHWDTEKLKEVRHRVDPFTAVARKTEPGVVEYFKGLSFEAVPVEMSKEDREVYDLLLSAAEQDHGSLLQYYQSLRYTCLGLESHLYSDNEVSELLRGSGITLSNKTSTKLDRMIMDVERIVEEGEKMLIFTHWTNLSLFRISEELTRRKIKHVIHYGHQTDKQNEESKQQFRTDASIPVLLTSDAGSHGMNMSVAKYVLNYECPYDYDTLMQRNDRIDRADSHLDGLEARVYYYQDTLEERIWNINNFRRRIASTVQGTDESLSRVSSDVIQLAQAQEAELSTDQRRMLMFGSKG